MAFTWPAAAHIYLSPHLDDVILSCGGSIYQQVQREERVAVVTIFAGSPPEGHRLSPFARSLHARWQESAAEGVEFSAPTDARRIEDIHAFNTLSPAIAVEHLPLPDCIYRTVDDHSLYTSENALFGSVHPDDPAINLLQQLPQPPASTLVYAPLGIGRHVDHQIVHEVAATWKTPSKHLRYYEDYPYAEEEAAETVLSGDSSCWRAILTPLSEEALLAKIEAIAQYESQIGTFWKNAEQMERALRKFAQKTGGERLWQRMD